MIQQIITILIVLVMTSLVFSPLKFSMFYILFRPLVQPFATEHYTLLTSIPLTGVFPIIVILYSFVTCSFRKDYTLMVPNAIFLYILIFFSSLSFLYTISYTDSIFQLLKIITALALYNLVYNAIKSTKDAKMILLSIVLTSIIPMFTGYYQFFTKTGHETYFGTAGRATGGFGFANMFGIFLALCFSAVLMLLFQEKGKFKRICLISILSSIIISSLIALNRGSWIAISASILFSIPFYKKKIHVRWFVIGAVLIGIFFSGLIVERFVALEEIKHGASQNTFKGRINMWENIIKLIPQQPITGFGIGNSRQIFEKFYGERHVPHNDYLMLLLEIGFVGALLYILFLCLELFQYLKLRSEQKLWFINFPTLMVIFYWIIISSTQNIIHNVTTFPIFLTIIATAKRWNEISHKESNEEA